MHMEVLHVLPTAEVQCACRIPYALVCVERYTADVAARSGKATQAQTHDPVNASRACMKTRLCLQALQQQGGRVRAAVATAAAAAAGA